MGWWVYKSTENLGAPLWRAAFVFVVFFFLGGGGSKDQWMKHFIVWYISYYKIKCTTVPQFWESVPKWIDPKLSQGSLSTKYWIHIVQVGRCYFCCSCYLGGALESLEPPVESLCFTSCRLNYIDPQGTRNAEYKMRAIWSLILLIYHISYHIDIESNQINTHIMYIYIYTVHICIYM